MGAFADIESGRIFEDCRECDAELVSNGSHGSCYCGRDGLYRIKGEMTAA